jgi:hypothetical protein
MTLKNMKDPCSDPGNSRILIRAKILCDYKKCFRAEFSTPVKECTVSIIRKTLAQRTKNVGFATTILYCTYYCTSTWDFQVALYVSNKMLHEIIITSTF